MVDPKPKGPVKGKEKPGDPPKEPKKTPEPTVEALQGQLANKNIELQELGEKYKLSSQEGEKIPKLKKDNEDLKAELEGYKSSGEIPLDEKELKKKYPDWDDLDDSERERIKTTERNLIMTKRIIAERRQEKVDNVKREEKVRFDGDFNKVLANPEFSERLKGKEKEFKEYCYSDENLGNTNLESLAKSFLFDVVEAEKKDKEKEDREGLETPGGGGKPTPTKEGYTTEEVAHMMKNDPKKYNRLVQEGKIKIIEE